MPELFGKYELIKRLGFGGMAEVFLARTKGVGGFEKDLAIKRLLPHCTEDQHIVDLLADEARITVRLTHPNIVQVFDFGKIDSSYYIAMEYIDGVDLKSLIEYSRDVKPLPLAISLYVVAALLEGLDFAHRRVDSEGQSLGIIHRDVTPHNILISKDGLVKLTDFGVARARISSHVSVVGDIRGKFSYMPPEQACGGELDHRVDLFAAGAILYELLTGKQPYISESTGEQMKKLNEALVPPSAYSPAISSTLDQIVLKALALDPDERFNNGESFAQELQAEIKSDVAISGSSDLQRRLSALIRECYDACLKARKNNEISQHAKSEPSIFSENKQEDIAPIEQRFGELKSLPEAINNEPIMAQPSVALSDGLAEEVERFRTLIEEDDVDEDKTQRFPVINRSQKETGGLAFAPTMLHIQSEVNDISEEDTLEHKNKKRNISLGELIDEEIANNLDKVSTDTGHTMLDAYELGDDERTVQHRFEEHAEIRTTITTTTSSNEPSHTILLDDDERVGHQPHSKGNFLFWLGLVLSIVLGILIVFVIVYW